MLFLTYALWPLLCSGLQIIDMWPGRSGPFSIWALQRPFGVAQAGGISLAGVPVTLQVGRHRHAHFSRAVQHS